MSTPPEDINLGSVLSETRRIIKANKNHFFILSLLFLLPCSILLFFLPNLFLTLFQATSTSTTPTSPYLLIPYIAEFYVLSIFATCTITYSSFHGYYNRPLELIPTLKSISSSFLRIFSTSFVLFLIISAFGFLISILGFLLYYFSGFNILSFLLFNIVIMLNNFVGSRFLMVNWGIYNVIVVVEEKWGYELLRRSTYLMNGMENGEYFLMGIVLRMNLIFGVLGGLLVFTCYWSSWTGDFSMWVLKLVVGSCGMTVLMVYGLAANVVMYIYSKKMRGELDMGVQEQEFVSLIVDDDGNKSIVGVVHG